VSNRCPGTGFAEARDVCDRVVADFDEDFGVRLGAVFRVVDDDIVRLFPTGESRAV
jgi:hypothetical protein